MYAMVLVQLPAARDSFRGGVLDKKILLGVSENAVCQGEEFRLSLLPDMLVFFMQGCLSFFFLCTSARPASSEAEAQRVAASQCKIF